MNNKKLFILFLILPIVLLSIPACNSNQEGNLNHDENSKLEFPLDNLIRAEERGEAEEFALQRHIELIDSNVTVIIECEPGQAEAVAKKASTLGTVELSVRDLVQVVIPITNLIALADIPGVHRVRLPLHPIPTARE